MEAVKIKIIFAPHGKAPRHRKISDNEALHIFEFSFCRRFQTLIFCP